MVAPMRCQEECAGTQGFDDVRNSVVMARAMTGAMVRRAELPRLLIAEHVMAMPFVRRRIWTPEDVDRLVGDRLGLTPRYELVAGDLLVTPAPTDRHQRIVAELYVLLRAYVTAHQLGEVRLGPARARISSDTRFEPDLFVVAAADGRRPPADADYTPLLLVVEVLSPGSARHDRITKRRHFLNAGLPEYWVVDGDAEAFEIWRSGDERPLVLDRLLAWRARAESPPFELDVGAFFDAVSD